MWWKEILANSRKEDCIRWYKMMRYRFSITDGKAKKIARRARKGKRGKTPLRGETLEIIDAWEKMDMSYYDRLYDKLYKEYEEFYGVDNNK